MDVSRPFEQGGAFAIGIVDGFDRALDPVDRPLGQLNDEAVMPGIEIVDGVERIVDAIGPGARLAIFPIAARRRRLVDLLVEARRQHFVVGAVGGRGDLQPAEQRRIALGKLDNHRDEIVVRLIREVGANARERRRRSLAQDRDCSRSRSARPPPCACRSRRHRRRDRCTRP